jgi:hypothetical protein
MPNQTARPRPTLLRALGAADPPAEIVVDGQTYERVELFKHDSWAATAVYDSGSQRIVCKFNRTQPIFGFPMLWLGKRLAARERRILEKLADLPGIPNPCGPIHADGRVLPNAAGHAFVSGHPLGKHEIMSPRFFSELRETILAMHSRGIAHVDLHKRENVIVGDDGRPYLIDFQISFDVTHPRVRWIAGIRAVFDLLCEGDHYHLAKHVRRNTPDGKAVPKRRPPQWLQLHRLAAVPFRELRRRLLVARGVRLGRGSVTTEAFAEDAFRREVSKAA